MSFQGFTIRAYVLPENEFGYLKENPDVDLRALMVSWEQSFQELFGIESMTYNVHVWVSTM